MTDESTSPPMLVVHLQWDDGSASHQETYGPWVVDDDMTHVAAMTQFLRDHQRLTGCRFRTAFMAVIVDPAGWVREAQERADASQAMAEAGVMSKDEAAHRFEGDGA